MIWTKKEYNECRESRAVSGLAVKQWFLPSALGDRDSGGTLNFKK